VTNDGEAARPRNDDLSSGREHPVSPYQKPVPVPDDATAGFWAAAQRHSLEFQRCDHCGNYAHPPVRFCQECHNLSGPSFTFTPITPRGTVLNWTVMHDAMVRGFQDEVPWVHAMVAFDDQPSLRFVSVIENGLTADLRIGAPVEVILRDVADGVTLPYFRLLD
jgi:uncharacterized OB-fold protein